MTTTEHEVAVFEEENGFKYILVWIDHEDVAAFADEYTEKEWQDAIEEHPFVAERNLPVVVAFEDENGEPRLFGPAEYVSKITEDFDWDSIVWGHNLTLEWDELKTRPREARAPGPPRARVQKPALTGGLFYGDDVDTFNCNSYLVSSSRVPQVCVTPVGPKETPMPEVQETPAPPAPTAMPDAGVLPGGKIAQLRGALGLLRDGIDGAACLVRDVHRAIASKPFDALSYAPVAGEGAAVVRPIYEGVTEAVYGSVLLVNRLVFAGLDGALSVAEAQAQAREAEAQAEAQAGGAAPVQAPGAEAQVLVQADEAPAPAGEAPVQAEAQALVQGEVSAEGASTVGAS